MAAVFVFLCTAAWIIFDGLSDEGVKADVALVPGYGGAAPGMENSRLDRVAQLYNGGEFPFVIVSGSMRRGSGASGEADTALERPTAMAQYLESKGVPANAVIVIDHGGETTEETARDVAEIMKQHDFHSVMIVTDYYHVTRTKLALSHEGVLEVDKVHVGALRKEDAWRIGREVVALYKYVGTVYLLPAAEKARTEAQVGMDKAKIDAEQAKQKVNKSLDNMAK